jgi:hypothetical protein
MDRFMDGLSTVDSGRDLDGGAAVASARRLTWWPVRPLRVRVSAGWG